MSTEAQPDLSAMIGSLPFTRSDIHILAIDDDPVQLKVVSQSLQKLEYKVTTACQGQEALEILAAGEKIDLVLSDVMMPVMNGPQFLAAARADPRFAETPIVMMSSNDQYEIVFDCLSKGADDYMIKPLSAQVLKNIYANIWIKRRQNATAAQIEHQIVESSLIAKRIEEIKKNFQLGVSTPVKDVMMELEKLVKDGKINGPVVPEIEALIGKLRTMNDGTVPAVAPKAAVPAGMKGFFDMELGGAKKEGGRVVAPVAVRAIKRRVANAPVAPMTAPVLQSLNLGDDLLKREFNVWKVNENMLVNLANDLLKTTDIVTDLGAKPCEMENFLRKVMQAHKLHPFHNFRRACDGLQFLAAALKQIKVPFTGDEIAGVMFAMLMRDIDHPGTNVLFQIRTRSQLAMTYNDRSALENNSASVGSKLLQDCFTFSPETNMFVDIRQTVIRCVLATDYSKLQKFLGNILSREMDWTKKDDRVLGLSLLVIMGDLAFALRPWDVADYWYGMMRDEQYQQGDMERRLGMPVTELMDRRVARPNALFIKTHFTVMVMSVFQAGLKIFPEMEKDLMTLVQKNIQIVEQLAAVEGQVPVKEGEGQ